MKLRWRVLTEREISERRRSGKEYFEFVDSWRKDCELFTVCVLEAQDEFLDWEEVPFHDP